EQVEAGVDIMKTAGTPLPDNVLASCRKTKVALKGPITTPIGTGFRSVNVALRKELDLYACIRPCKTYPGVKTRYEKIDLDVVREVAKKYPGIEYEERLIDNMCMQLVQKPELYDVICLPNLYGDILSDLCAGLIGGLGIAPGANIGDNGALFEAVHGSAPKYA